MNKSCNRLMKARQMAGYRSARAAAEALAAKPSTYAAHENGSRGFGIAYARRYAELFSVSPGWILTGEYFETDLQPRVSDDVIADDIHETSSAQTSSRLNVEDVVSDEDIFKFGKQALELLKQFTPAPKVELAEDTISVGEVFIPQMANDYVPTDEGEGWEYTSQWQFPLKFISDVLKVGSKDIALLGVVDDNMSPTYKIGDRLIIDFQQKDFTVEGVYFFLTEDEQIHIQNIKIVKKRFKLSNDKSAQHGKHPEKIVDKDSVIIHGKICGVIAAR